MVKNAKNFLGRPLKLKLVLEMCRKAGLYMNLKVTDGLKCTVFEKIAQKDSGFKELWFQVEKTQISLDLKIYSNNKIILNTSVDFLL